MVRLISERANSSASAEYLKLTFSNSTEPSATSSTGFSGFTIADFSQSTSSILRADSADIVIITYIIESIISDISTCTPYVSIAES